MFVFPSVCTIKKMYALEAPRVDLSRARERSKKYSINNSSDNFYIF